MAGVLGGTRTRPRAEPIRQQRQRSCERVPVASGGRLSYLDAFTHDHPFAVPPAPSRLRARWAADLDPECVLPEYPRPQLVREAWINLNGKWDFSVTDDDVGEPAEWDGQILVPFAAESPLGGANVQVRPDQRVWYRRAFTTTPVARGTRWLLHFGAVDWETTVHVNGVNVGEHRGGYDPFSFDITDALGDSDVHEVIVGVWDPSDRGPQPRGRQALSPDNGWHTAVTGIWQTVWLEPVLSAHISSLYTVADIDAETVTVHVTIDGGDATFRASVEVVSNGVIVADTVGKASQPITLRIPGARLWSPDDPFLYDLRVTISGGDEVTSYFGMRKIAIERDSTGTRRILLNNVPIVQHGVVDEGTWPEGLYTAPTDEALRSGIEELKRSGFNMIRKWGKVEPARWYAHADRAGMIVWQDMPSGANDQPERRNEFARELRAMIDSLRAHPSILVWVAFNEGWGQFDAEEHVAWLREYDPSRIVRAMPDPG